MKYEVCENCGAHLDHGEKCDCTHEAGETSLMTSEPLRAEPASQRQSRDE